MIIWVAERALMARNVNRVIVATDDQRIVDAVRSEGLEAVMTRADHASGTDRIAEVAATLDDAEVIVNVQGDEPLISPETIDRAVEAMAETHDCEPGTSAANEDNRKTIGIVTTWEPVDSETEVLNPDVVKIVVDETGLALYFSRSPVPYPRDAVREYGSIEAALSRQPGLLAQFRKHTGLYVYRRDVLLEFTKWPQSELERAESLEQLRALEHGVRIKVIEASTRSIGVDTKDDLERVRSILEQESASLHNAL